MNCSMPALPVHHQLPESTQTHVHRVGDAINHLILCHPLLLLPSIFPSIRVFSNESANLDSLLKSRDDPLLTNVRLVKPMVSPVVMYGCESWTINKAECQRIDAFELWCGEDSLHQAKLSIRQNNYL